MEWIFYIGVVLFILFGPWVLVWWANSRRKSERAEDQVRWADLTSRIHKLEGELREMRGQGAPAQPVTRKQPAVETPPVPAASVAVPAAPLPETSAQAAA